VTKGREEITQLALAQTAIFDGDRHEGLAFIQKRVGSRDNLETWKQNNT